MRTEADFHGNLARVLRHQVVRYAAAIQKLLRLFGMPRVMELHQCLCVQQRNSITTACQ
jgi:hypothetical protein